MKKFFILLFCLVSFGAVAQEGIKNLPQVKRNLHYKSSSNVLFFEGFDKTQLPDNWTDSISAVSYSWRFQQLPDFPFSEIDNSSKASAVCPWRNDTIDQNEWLISPLVEIPDSFTSVFLDFYAGYSKGWLSNANLELYVGDFGVADTTWTRVWNAKSVSDTLDNSWYWRQINKSISSYSGKKIKLAFRYIGNDGDLVAIDNVSIFAYTLSQEAQILSFSIPEEVEDAIIDAENHEVHVTILHGTSLDSLVPTFSLSPRAKSEPASGDTIKVVENEAFTYVVKAADTTSIVIWKLYVTQSAVQQGTDFLSFSVVGQKSAVQIDTINNFINVEVGCDVDLDSLVASFTLSSGASADLVSGDTIKVEENIPFPILVTAQDDTISSKWQLVVTVSDYHRLIEKFSLAEQTGTAIIDTTAHTVFLEVKYGTDLSKLVPYIQVSDCGTSIPASGDTIAFENNVAKEFEVFASDTTLGAQKWYVTLKLARNSLYLYGFDVNDTLPPLDWQIITNNSKTWTIHKVDDLPFTSIDKRSKFSAICPWSADSAQDEWLISPYIDTKSFADNGINDLKLVFYAGYNYTFMEGNANLKCYVKTASTDWTPIWQLSENSWIDNKWYWHDVLLSLDSYLGDSIQLAWQYEGINGDLVAIDGVNLFSDPTAGINSNIASNFDISVYPNPNKGNFVIRAKEKYSVKIYSINGRLMLNKEIYPNENRFVKSWKKGIYLMQIQNKKGQIDYRKLIID